MGLATFKGGIHPYEGKELSESKPIQVLLPKGELVYPMSQHIGAPAKRLAAFLYIFSFFVRYSKGHRAETDGQRRYGSVCDR